MRENFEIFEFELAPEDLDAITALDQGEEGRTGPHPDTFAPLVVNQPAT
jgi:2,5-diketo-D-gluconate reductase A